MHKRGWLLPALVGVAAGMLLTLAAIQLAPTRTPTAAPPTAADHDGEDERLAAFKARSPHVIEEYLRTHDVRKLQIGAGSSQPDGWLNTDIEPGEHLAYLDATERFPLQDESVHYIFSEHVIEHLTLEGGAIKLAESFRVLAPGGRIRIATPDLLQLVALFGTDPAPAARRYLDGKLLWHDWPRHPNPAAVILNLQLREFGHLFVYDAATLQAALERAGFEAVKIVKLGESDDPHLRGLEGRPGGWIAELNEYETMVLEADKPGGV